MIAVISSSVVVVDRVELLAVTIGKVDDEGDDASTSGSGEEEGIEGIFVLSAEGDMKMFRKWLYRKWPTSTGGRQDRVAVTLIFTDQSGDGTCAD